MMRGADPKAPHRGAVALSIAIAAALPTCAVAKTEAGASVSLSTAVASNPFQSALAGSETVSALIDVSPWVTITDTETMLKLAGDVRVTEYAKTFPRSETFRLSADGTWQVNPRLMLATNMSYAESIIGETNLLQNLTPGLVLIEDPTLIGSRSRQRSFNTSATAQYRPDARQRWSFNLYASDNRFSNLGSGNDYSVYGGNISYDRVMRRGTFGAALNLQRYECRSLRACSQFTASPQLTATVSLSPKWTLSGGAGVSYSTISQPTFSRNTLSPSVNATLCRKDARSSVCLSASHSVEATALEGSRPIVASTLSASYRLTERNTLSLSGNYAGSTSASTGTIVGPVGDTFSYFGARLSDEHRVGRNVYVFATGSHTISDSSFVSRRTNTEVSLGVRFSIGRGA